MIKSGRDRFFRIFKVMHTLKHLKYEQTYGRVHYKLKRRFTSRSFDKKILEGIRKYLGTALSTGLGVINLTFNNVPRRALLGKILWNRMDYGYFERPEKLWIYKLNYFDWLSDENLTRQEGEYAILDWMQKNPYSKLESWEPYPLSKRLISWVKWLKKHKDNTFVMVVEYINHGILVQMERLYVDLEHHNQGNHLMKNLEALLVSADYLLGSGFKAPKFLRRTVGELINQINLQILPDGGHFERSPMYHLEMMEALESALEALKRLSTRTSIPHFIILQIRFTISMCEKAVARMKIWLDCLTHPDGNMTMFGDSTALPGGSYEAAIKNLNQDVNNPNVYSKYFEHSRFFIYRSREVYFALTAAPPSPDFQPGHSHCDALSFELSYWKTKIITDTGCGSYQDREIRDHCRSTYSHNVPMVQGHEQSDFYDLFRYGKRCQISQSRYKAFESLILFTLIDQYDQTIFKDLAWGTGFIEVSERLVTRRVTGPFISVLHITQEASRAMKQMPNNIIRFDFELGYYLEIQCKNDYRIVPHTYYTDFGKSAQGQKIILSNKEGSNIKYVIRWT